MMLNSAVRWMLFQTRSCVPAPDKLNIFSSKILKLKRIYSGRSSRCRRLPFHFPVFSQRNIQGTNSGRMPTLEYEWERTHHWDEIVSRTLACLSDIMCICVIIRHVICGVCLFNPIDLNSPFDTEKEKTGEETWGRPKRLNDIICAWINWK